MYYRVGDTVISATNVRADMFLIKINGNVVGRPVSRLSLGLISEWLVTATEDLKHALECERERKSEGDVDEHNGNLS